MSSVLRKHLAWYVQAYMLKYDGHTIYQGGDIPHIRRVIQYMVTDDLSTLDQRLRRGGRDGQQAEGILLVEKSVFEHKAVKGAQNRESILDCDESETEPKNNVESSLREYVETEDCRREVKDEHFDNPPHELCQYFAQRLRHSLTEILCRPKGALLRQLHCVG